MSWVDSFVYSFQDVPPYIVRELHSIGDRDRLVKQLLVELQSDEQRLIADLELLSKKIKQPSSAVINVVDGVSCEVAPEILIANVTADQIPASEEIVSTTKTESLAAEEKVEEEAKLSTLSTDDRSQVDGESISQAIHVVINHFISDALDDENVGSIVKHAIFDIVTASESSASAGSENNDISVPITVESNARDHNNIHDNDCANISIVLAPEKDEHLEGLHDNNSFNNGCTNTVKFVPEYDLEISDIENLDKFEVFNADLMVDVYPGQITSSLMSLDQICPESIISIGSDQQVSSSLVTATATATATTTATGTVTLKRDRIDFDEAPFKVRLQELQLRRQQLTSMLDENMKLASACYDVIDKQIGIFDKLVSTIPSFQAEFSNAIDEDGNRRRRKRKSDASDRNRQDDVHGGIDVLDSLVIPVPQPGEPTYCFCKNISYGEMIGCDNSDCPIEWFHYGCVGLLSAPIEGATWFCQPCQESMTPAES